MLPLVVLGAAAWYLSRPQRNPDWITVGGKHRPLRAGDGRSGDTTPYDPAKVGEKGTPRATPRATSGSASSSSEKYTTPDDLSIASGPERYQHNIDVARRAPPEVREALVKWWERAKRREELIDLRQKLQDDIGPTIPGPVWRAKFNRVDKALTQVKREAPPEAYEKARAQWERIAASQARGDSQAVAEFRERLRDIDNRISKQYFRNQWRAMQNTFDTAYVPLVQEAVRAGIPRETLRPIVAEFEANFKTSLASAKRRSRGGPGSSRF